MTTHINDMVIVGSSSIQRILDILLAHGIFEDFQLPSLPSSADHQPFLQLITAFFKRKYRDRDAVDLNCLTAILCELSLDRSYDQLLVSLTDLLPFCRMRNSSLCKLVDILRSSSRGSRVGMDVGEGLKQRLPLAVHSAILRALSARVLNDDPPHIFFPGDKDSYLQISSIPWQCTTGYTLMIWLKIPASIAAKSFELFRCRNPNLNIDAAMLYLADEGAFTVRVVTNSERRGRDEIRGKVLMTTDAWHLLTIKHTNPKDGADQMIISVDGVVFVESELNFPSATALSNESHWTFGIGFAGMMSNVTFYEVDLPPNAIKFIHALGPFLTELRQGVSYPQSSYDSGHTTLGSLISKGAWPARLNAIPTGFCVTAVVTSSGGTMMQQKPSDNSNYYVEMVPQTYEGDSSVVVSATGRSLVCLQDSCVENLLEGGGCSLFIYLFWAYSCSKSEDIDAVSALAHSAVVKECLLLCLGLLSNLIRVHADFKEQFIQLHGFHIVAHCLSTMSTEVKAAVIDKTMVDACIQLVEALGQDSVFGDGIASAFQGLLFDFRIWGGCDLSTLKYFLEGTSSVALKAGDQLFKCIGIQKVLDVFRVHISRALTVSSSSMLGNDALVGLLDEESPEQLARDCANEIHRLMIIIKDAAVECALKTKVFEPSLDTDALLICLAETNNTYLAERILRLMANIRITNPSALQRSLITNRYYDTILISLWMKKGFSLEVRSSALSYLLWLLSIELKEIPVQIIQARKAVELASNASAKTEKGRSKSVASPNDPSRTRAIIAQIREQIKPIVRWWKILNMLSDVMTKALDEGVWGDFSPSCLVTANAKAADSATPLVTWAMDVQPSGQVRAESDQAMWFMVQELAANNQADAWVLLPFLPPLLSRVDPDVCQKVLMQLNILFKTEDAQSEAIAHLEDRAWIEVFAELALIGEIRSNHSNDTTDSHSQAVASTCMELSLEMLSIVMDYKIKFHPAESTKCWSVLEECFQAVCKANINDAVFEQDVEKRMMRRCISLVLQRLVKSTDDCWRTQTYRCVENLFNLVSQRNLCGVTPICDHATAMRGKVEEDLLGLYDDVVAGDEVHLRQSHDETHILSLVLDLMKATRKMSGRGSVGGGEWSLLRSGLQIVLSCLGIVPELLYDRVSEEIMGYMRKISENTAPFTAPECTKLVMSILLALKAVSSDGFCDPHMRSRYCSTVFDIISHFCELRRTLYTKGYNVPTHVEEIVEALLFVENQNDIVLIFSILEATVKDRNPVKKEIVTKPIVEDDQDIIDYTSVPEPGEERTSFNLLDELPVLAMTSDIEKDDFQFGDGAAVADSTNSPMEGLSSPDATVAPPPVQPEQAAAESAEAANSRGFQTWLRVRQGIIAERVDTERARLTRIMNAQDLSAEATRKFWRKCRRKIEAESFGEAHRCQWKLGVAHEGNFFGRKRIVMRPRFDNIYAANSESHLAAHEEAEISSEELNRALAKQCSGYIKDVTRSENPDAKEEVVDEKKSGTVDSSESAVSGTPIPGTGWGLVDADGSEDGFGVVGLLQDPSYIVEDMANQKEAAQPAAVSMKAPVETTKAPPAAPSEPSMVGDMMGDVHLLEENLRLGKTVIETGPCHSGTYRVGSGLAKLEARVVMVTASGNFWGFLSFNGKEIFFRSSFEQEDVHKEDNASVNLVKEQRMRRRRWLLSTVSGIYLRRFRLRDSALEVFFRRGKHRNFFVDFGHTKENAKQRNEFAKALMQAAPSNAFKQNLGMTPFRMVYEHGVQEKWLAGKMSNFDYLIALNTIAGRSYNDLCQYPVMPWVLNDFKSESLDLRNPAIFRDLSKPMGALNENRLKEFLDRFYSFEDNVSSGIPAFMYGSHYSTMVGVVLHFLVRLQPYAALHREMQNGHFDVPDRLFSSIPRSFQHNTTQLSEVKELIPEWFTTPDMFRNVNQFHFGHTQDGDVIDDVELPPWAKTPEEFVRIHREALESDYVTEHLHEWIDLIFGYKQRGPDAIEAKNVFYYLTYYGAVDHYMIEDETLRRATELQIAHFGQIPMQLFRTPHPARKVSGPNATFPLMRSLRQNFALANTKDFKGIRSDEESIAFHAPCTLVLRKTQSVVIQVAIFIDRVVCILDNGVIEVLKYSTSEEAKAALAFSAATNADRPPNSGPNSRSGARRSRAPSLEKPPKPADRAVDKQDDLLQGEFSSELPTPPGRKMSNLSDGDDLSYSMVCSSLLREGEVLIYVEKEYAHFETVPRVPLPRHYRMSDNNHGAPAATSGAGQKDALETLMKVKPQMQSTMTTLEKLSQLVTFSRSSKLCLAAGRIDGTIIIRELDDRSGFIRSAGEFSAHRRRVVSIAMDTNPPEYDIVASVDEGGTILVWTILNTKAKGVAQGLGQPVHVISRRPQRQFRCNPPDDCGDATSGPIQLDISSQMGIVVAVSGENVHVFSIERNELLVRFVLSCFSANRPTKSHTAMTTDSEGNHVETTFTEYAFNGPVEDALESKAFGGPSAKKEDYLAPKYFPRRMVVSDYGMIIVHVESFLYIESLVDFEDQLHQQHMLIAHTVSGVATASQLCASPVTCLICPDRGDVVVTGHQDGAVRFYRCQDLVLLHQLYPHSFCATVSLALPGTKFANHQGSAGGANGGGNPTAQRRKPAQDGSNSVAPSAIISIAVGPNRGTPTVLCVSTEAGAVYFRAFPDFVRWEKQRQPSTLAQLVNSAPLQAVKGTLLQAQNWTQETAGVFAQNARSLADDAVTELKKFQRSSIMKGVVNFFGGTKPDDPPSRGNSTHGKK